MNKVFGFFAALLAPAMAMSAGREFATTECHKYGQPEIQFSLLSASIPDTDARWFIDTLQSQVASGTRFKAGETLQLGWLALRFESSSNNSLRLKAPDMKGIPITYADSVDSALSQLRAQKDVVESFSLGSPLSFPTFMQAAAVPKRFARIKTTALVRESPQDQISGWQLFDASLENPPDPDQYVSLYELAVARPDLIKFFALPVGTAVLIDSGQIQLTFNRKRQMAKPGSFVDLLNQANAQTKH